MTDQNITELREIAEKPPFADGGIGDLMFQGFHAYTEEYVLSTEGADYEPNEFERELIQDFVNGLFSDERFFGPIRAMSAALLSSAEAREEAERGYHRRGVKIIELTEHGGAHLCGAEKAEAFFGLALACLQAAETRAQQAEARVMELTAALRPFAEAEVRQMAFAPLEDSDAMFSTHTVEQLRFQDFHAARQALGASHG